MFVSVGFMFFKRLNVFLKYNFLMKKLIILFFWIGIFIVVVINMFVLIKFESESKILINRL